MDTVYFLAACFPVSLVEQFALVMTWIDTTEFELCQTYTEMAPQQTSLLQPGKKSGLVTIQYIYCKGHREDFKKYFGMEYSLQILKLIGPMVAKKCNEIKL